MYIYIDESGDFGSIKKSKKYFLIALVASKSNRQFDIFMRRVKSRKLSKKQRKVTELKGHLASKSFLKYFYSHLQKLDFKIVAAILDKKEIPVQLKKEEGIIYLQMLEQGLEPLLKQSADKFSITIDRRHYRKITKEAFNLSLKNFLLFNHRLKVPITIHHLDSTTNRNIQFADFITYAFSKKYNFQDDGWYNMIKDKILEEIKVKLMSNKK